MNYTWDLSILYTGFDDPEFSKDIASLENALGEMVKFADSADRLG